MSLHSIIVMSMLLYKVYCCTGPSIYRGLYYLGYLDQWGNRVEDVSKVIEWRG